MLNPSSLKRQTPGPHLSLAPSNSFWWQFACRHLILGGNLFQPKPVPSTQNAERLFQTKPISGLWGMFR